MENSIELRAATMVPEHSQAARRRRAREALIRWAVTIVGLTGIAAVGLIIVFIAKEALPLLFEAGHKAEASFGKMFLPQVVRPGKPATFVWQPVGAIPKV